MTFGLLDAIAPLSEDGFYDPDNPYLVVSDIMGTIAGEALMIVLTGGGKNVCINVCFAEGTLVATEDGLGPIEDVRPGDLVWSFDEATGCATLSSVVRTFESEADEIVEITIGDETIRVTPEHPFWVDGLGWMPAGELRAGTPVLARDGSVAAAAIVRSVPGPARVFNVEVGATHTYFVTDRSYVVHNVCVSTLLRRAAAQASSAANRLTSRQMAAAARNPHLTQMFRGERVDAAFRQIVGRDARITSRATVTPRGTFGPDVWSTRGGAWWDLTTRGQGGAHIRKYGPGGRIIPW